MKILLPLIVRQILSTFVEAGYEIYIVGGVTRDILMNKTSNDWDFTTNANPEVILSLFKNSFYDNRFGTVGVIDPEDKTTNKFGKPLVYDITTFRQEEGYTDQRHPDKITWGKTLDEDLVRRDFTINAIAFKPLPNQSIDKTHWEMEIIDPHQGQIDLKNKLIKAVGDPDERFQEDALRMMRAIRLSTQLEFKIEDHTFEAIKNNLNLIEKISWERIRDELLKMLSYPFAADGYMLLHSSGLAEKILPEVEKGFGVDQKSPGRHHIYDVGTHSVLSLKNTPSKNPIVRLATLIHDIGKPITYQKSSDGLITFYNHEYVGANLAKVIANRLRLSRLDRDHLVSLVRWHQFSVDERQTDKAIRRFIRNVGKENLEDILAVRTGDRLGGGATETSWRLEAFKRKLVEVQKHVFSITDLKVNGKDVMTILDIKPGPKVGEILNKLFTQVEDDPSLNTREHLLSELQKLKKDLK